MKTVAIGLLGTNKDRRGRDDKRWDRWRPTVSMCQHDDLLIDRLELLHDNHSQRLADQVAEDIALISPETTVVHHRINFADPWDFESVYSILLDFVRSYDFKLEEEHYLTHITTGTHVAQICLYLLTEAGYLPSKLLQTSPASSDSFLAGQYQIIDLDLSKYDQIASRFTREAEEATSFLKGGIATSSTQFNAMIDQLEKVSLRSSDPILITGPTGAGKSQLAERVYELKKQQGVLSGRLVSVNCATLKGENAMSALFGHKKGAFTGAASDRAGLLVEANHGLLFLDEIGELGLDEQAMLLKAVEDKRFMPFGSDQEVSSDFQLIAGTNRDLINASQLGQFREDLLARIDLWTYQLPSLKDRIEDLEPNIQYELDRFSKKAGHLIRFNKQALDCYLDYASSKEALWSANFRDLNASVTRMCTLSEGGRITLEVVEEEIKRLKHRWKSREKKAFHTEVLDAVLGEEKRKSFDLYDQITLAGIIDVCRQSRSMAEAGRKLFSVSRLEKKSVNDSNRVKQLLEKYGVAFTEL